ncbi:MAG: hypothetical protein D3910_00475 [Candidatus Electrothrix sp. ATG2]|nr:hypothetical protein [Candidatus Electrothrix sp. ATG2]
MLKKIGIGLFLGSILMCYSASALAAEMPEPNGAAVWKFITEESSFKDWKRLPEIPKTHGAYVPDTPEQKTYANKQALESTKLPLNNGAMVAKYNLSPANEIKAITIMYKVKGYNPSAGDWFWVEYDPEGKVLKEGKDESCIKCHSRAADNDHLLAHDLGK